MKTYHETRVPPFYPTPAAGRAAGCAEAYPRTGNGVAVMVSVPEAGIEDQGPVLPPRLRRTPGVWQRGRLCA